MGVSQCSESPWSYARMYSTWEGENNPRSVRIIQGLKWPDGVCAVCTAFRKGNGAFSPAMRLVELRLHLHLTGVLHGSVVACCCHLFLSETAGMICNAVHCLR